jgi:hypothetical protein
MACSMSLQNLFDFLAILTRLFSHPEVNMKLTANQLKQIIKEEYN